MRWQELKVDTGIKGYRAYGSKGAGNIYVVEFSPRHGFRASWTNRRAAAGTGPGSPKPQRLGTVYGCLEAAHLACSVHKDHVARARA